MTIMGIKTTIGCTNYREPKGMYVEYRFFIQPTVEHNNYKHKVNGLKQTIEKAVENYVDKCGFLSDRVLVVLDAAHSQMRLGKSSYIFVQIIFRQDKMDDLVGYDEALKIMVENIGGLTDNIIHSLPKNDFVIVRQ